MSVTTARLQRRATVGGPGLERRPADLQLANARDTTRAVGRTFALACRLLPAAVRDDVYLLYLVFRTLDDLVDERRDEAPARIAAVAEWARGRPALVTPEVQLLQTLAARHPLPRQAFAAFCDGMTQDLRQDEFATESDVDRYCFRVAGTVGLVLTSVLGASDPRRATPAAAALGIAMQRTNILRDIDEDADKGRVYIAREAWTRHGSLAPGRRAALVREQIARADAFYEQGLAGVGLLIRGRRAVAAAGAMYREILRQIERDGHGTARGRAVVSTPRKLVIATAAAARA